MNYNNAEYSPVTELVPIVALMGVLETEAQTSAKVRVSREVRRASTLPATRATTNKRAIRVLKERMMSPRVARKATKRSSPTAKRQNKGGTLLVQI